jgi:hypothetical protein
MRAGPVPNDESDEIDRTGEAARLREKGRSGVFHMFARIPVDSTSSTRTTTSFSGALSAPFESRKGVNQS